jgi:hypothetical protein
MNIKNVAKVNEPIITICPIIASTLSILGDDSNTCNWISNNFLQLMHMESNVLSMFVTFMEHHAKENDTILVNNPNFDSIKLKKSYISGLFQSFFDFIVFTIDKGYCIHVSLDRYYLSASGDYGTNHFLHPVLIYGYDTETKMIAIKEYFINNKYSKYTIPINEIENAFSTDVKCINWHDEYIEDVYIAKKKESDYTIDVDTKIIKRGLLDFLESKDSTMKFYGSYRWSDCTCVYGVNAIDKIILDISTASIDLRSLQTICDYIKIMEFRLENLYKNKIITITAMERLFDTCVHTACEAILFRNLWIKSDIKKQYDIKGLKVKFEKLTTHICELVNDVLRAM